MARGKTTNETLERVSMINDLNRLVLRLATFADEVKLTREEIEDITMIKRRMFAWIDKLDQRGHLAALDAQDTNQLLAELKLMVEKLP